ncbi:hypothetical protein [Congregicoccus parvus]|uniref:hypothetical protein n=1 Tax=Congregicoccus parvus TaxID=3081749 RepID=UPI003FA5E550
MARIDDAADAAKRVEALVAESDARGVWQFDKRWEVAINAVAPEDMPRLLERVERCVTPAVRQLVREALISRWAEEEPRGAIAWAAAIGNPAQRAMALKHAAHGWAYVDALAAGDWVAGLEGADRVAAAQGVAAFLAVVDPERAAQLVVETAGATSGWDAVAKVFETWAAREPQAARKGTVGLAAEIRPAAYAGVARGWAGHDPAAALAWCVEQARDTGYDWLVRAVVPVWAYDDVTAAAAAVSALPPGALRQMGAAALVEAWRTFDLAAADAWNEAHGRNTDGYADGSAVNGDPVEALSRARAMPVGNERRGLLYSALGQLAAVDPLRAWAELETLKPGGERESLRHTVLQEWAQRDAGAALRAVEALPGSSNREQAMGAVFNILAMRDPDGAVARLRSLGPGETRGWIHGLVHALGNGGARHVVQAMDALEGEPGLYEAVAGVVASLANRDPAGALAVAGRVPAGPERVLAFGSAVSAIAGNDLDAALQSLQEVPPDVDRVALLRHIGDSLAYADPESAADVFAVLPPGQARDALAQRLAGAWAAADSDAALAWATNLPEGGARTGAMESVAESLIQFDPRRAVSLLSGIGGGERSSYLLPHAVSEWTRHEPEGAVQWAIEIDDPALRARALPGVCRALVDTFPEKAMDLAVAFAGNGLDSNTVVDVAQRWVQRDPYALAEWAKTHAPASARDLVLGAAVGGVAHRDLAAARGMLELMNEPTAAREATAVVAFAWASQDAPAAANWSAALADPTARADAVAHVATSWYALDSPAASRWILSLPADGARDRAAAGLALQLSHSEPARAAEWAARVSGGAERHDAVASVFANWTRSDRARAREWGASMGLDAARMDELAGASAGHAPPLP